MRYAVAGRAVLVGAMLAVAATAADAKCTRLAFSVNDYGKDGPTQDAKGLLDKYIAKWAADRGIKKYTTGKKTVNCELFLDFGVFDEHTCKAEASVCWGEGGSATTAAVPATAPSPAPAAPAGEPRKAKAVKAAVPKAKAVPASGEPPAPAARPPAPKAKTGQPT